MKNTEIYHEAFNINSKLVKLSQDIEEKCRDVFERIKNISAYNQSKVIRAMQEYGVSESHFVDPRATGTTTGAGKYWRKYMQRHSVLKMPLSGTRSPAVPMLLHCAFMEY